MRLWAPNLLLLSGLVALKEQNAQPATSNSQIEETAVTKNFAEGVYRGQLNADGERDGWGTFTWYGSKKVYVGEWKNDQRHGRGTTKFSNLDQFQGLWRRGKAQGRGVFVWADGSCYQGSFKDDKFHGSGVFTAISGNRYVGQYQHGRRHGHGVANMTYGDSYEGYFKDDKYNGNGIYTWSDGRQYKGQFKNSELHGNGELISSNGRRRQVGTWKDGVFLEGTTHSTQSDGLACPTTTDCAALHVEEVCDKGSDSEDGEVCQIHIW